MSKLPDQPGTPSHTAYATVWEARPRKFKNVIIQVCFFILLMELAERLSYYGINQGLKNFMQLIGWSSASASALKSSWTSICYLSPLLGAYLADEKWGRFRTILIFGIWYCIGDFLVAIAAHPDVHTNKALVNPIFTIGLFAGVGIGTGAIKSNVITFGADQFDPNDPKEEAQKETYFSYFYFCINLGATVSYGYLSVLSVEGSGLIPQKYGYFATYMICAIVMMLAICFLVIGRSRYIYMDPNDNAISNFVRLCADTFRLNAKAKILIGGTASLLAGFVVNIIAAFTSDQGSTGRYFSYLAGVLVFIGVVAWVYTGMDNSFMDDSKVSNGGTWDDTEVEGYKRMILCLPFAAFTIIWHCAYDQTDANFQSITHQCDLRWNRNDVKSKQVPGAALGVFDPIVIVIAIPILDTFIYPAYTRFAGKPPSQFGKSVAGFIVAFAGITWAGIFEIIRRNTGHLKGPDEYPKGSGNFDFVLDRGSHQPMNDIPWAAAIPNYVMIALAECLINVTAFDVFYSTVPLKIKSLAQAVNLMMSAMGSILTSVFTLMFKKSIPNNLNDGNLEYMYFTLSAVSLLNLFAFVAVMKKMNFGMSSSEKYDEFETLAKESVSSRQSVAAVK
ncbi:TPA: hypothetical protein N0F65_002679 [Lagenidium giganteum]|uniref:Uncharacterized protein n=1 Tax=Lagenidium giganteum TaxID=4803 RepID=A0AAV2Z687_9STRA|nr:TPA: hypothetical protein N0F65_002679 [Lagenidium giganteum]